MTNPNPYAALATDAVCGLSPYEPGMPPAELERRYGISNAVKLASNENPDPLPASVIKAMQTAVEDVTRYPDGGSFVLRDRLAAHLAVEPEQLTLGNGSNDVLVLLAETFLTPQHAAVYDEYSFVVYRLAVQAAGAEARVAPANPADHPQPLGHDLDAMRALVDEKTRLVFIANPNNPTGTWVTDEALRDFISSLPAHVIVVLDEAYFEYARDADAANAIDWLAEYPNLVVVRTFSKAYGLAGLRVGYSVSSAGIAELLNRIRQPFNVNSIAQAAAIAALEEQDWVSASVARNQVEIDRVRSGLEVLGIHCLPSRANFLLAHCGADAAECHDYLLHQGVIVRPVANYGLPEYLRISIGTGAENTRLLEALAGFRNS